MFEITNTNSTPVLMNTELQKATDNVIALNNANIRNDYQIAAIFAQVEKSGCFTDDGFKNVTEWGIKCIGFKRAQCYNYLKVGKEYIREIISNKGKNLGYCSNLLPIPGDESNREVTSFGTEPAPAPDKDFNMSQTIAISRIETREQAIDLIHEGVISPDMSVRDIKKVIEKFKNPEGSDDGDEVEQTEQPEQSEQTEKKRKRDLSKVETADLIEELIKRGFRVTDNDGHVWETE